MECALYGKLIIPPPQLLHSFMSPACPCGHFDFYVLLLNVYSFTWLCQVLIVAHKSFVANAGSSSSRCSLPWLPCGNWDLSSLARDWTHISCIGTQFLATGPPKKSLDICFDSCISWLFYPQWNSQVTQWWRIRLPRQETQVQSLGWEKSPGVGNSNPLQYSCLGNAMDRGAWPATVHGVAKSWTWLSMHSCVPTLNST